jgi:hypothetical protein
MNTVFFQKDQYFMPGQDNPDLRHEKLPVGTYLLQFNPMTGGFFLEATKDFELPKKLYGNLKQRAVRILNTFAQRPSTTGVHLSGEKGSGKTLLTKLISTIGQEHGISTVIVNFPATGDGFNMFLQSIEQPLILLFDEFEKVYPEEAQQELLTLLDGLFSTKKLFLLTSNNYSKINENMKNRPGRVFYHLEFEGLDHEFIQEYGADNLKNKSHLSNLGVLAGFIKPMNFDMLQAIIEECNRYNEPPMDTLAMLNVKAHGYLDSYVYELTVPNIAVIEDEDRDVLIVNPLREISVPYYYKVTVKAKKGKPTQESQYNELEFGPRDLVAMDGIAGAYEYKRKDGATLSLKRKPVESKGLSQVAHLL